MDADDIEQEEEEDFQSPKEKSFGTSADSSGLSLYCIEGLMSHFVMLSELFSFMQ